LLREGIPWFVKTVESKKVDSNGDPGAKALDWGVLNTNVTMLQNKSWKCGVVGYGMMG